MRKTDEEKYALVKRYYDGEPVAFICSEQGLAKSTFYSWLKPYKTTSTESGVIVSGAEFIKMKNKVDRLEKMIEVLQKVDCNIDCLLYTSRCV